jgi:hypothetical protein
MRSVVGLGVEEWKEEGNEDGSSSSVRRNIHDGQMAGSWGEASFSMKYIHIYIYMYCEWGEGKRRREQEVIRSFLISLSL